MSWNRPSDAPQPQPKKSASPSLKRGLLAGLAVVLGAGLAAWLLTNGEADSRPLQKKDRGLIKEVAPAAAPTNVNSTVSRPRKLTKLEAHELYVSNKLAAARAKSPWGHLPRRVVQPRSLGPKRFDRSSEELIAELLEIKPGQTVMGGIPFDQRFLEDLKQAMIFPTQDKESDDAYTKELKQAVRETLNDLKERMLGGEDICETMRKTWSELQDQSRYKMQLMNELEEMRQSGKYSGADMKDAVEAANRMMETKGMSPLSVPKMFLRKIEIMERKEKLSK